MEDLRSWGLLAKWRQVRGVWSGKGPMMKVVFKICLTTLCMYDGPHQRGQAFILLEPSVVSDTMCSRFIFLPWFLIFSILSVRNFCFPQLWTERAPPSLYTQFLGGGSPAHKILIKYAPLNSRSILLKVLKCRKEIPLYLSCITKVVRVGNWKERPTWQNYDKFGSISLNKRKVWGRPGTWRRLLPKLTV